MTTGDISLTFIWAIGLIVLCISALAARRVPIRGALRIGLIWVAIFTAISLAIAMFMGD